MNRRTGASVIALFSLCKGVRDVANLKEVVHLLYSKGYLAADGTQPNVRSVPQHELDGFVETRRRDMAVFKSGGLYSYAFPVVAKRWELVRCSFSCHFHENGVTTTLGGSVVQQSNGEADPVEYIEPFAQDLVQTAKQLYEIMQPAYGYIDDPLAAEYPGSPLQRAMERQIISLNWVNFFGPEYVDQYGRDFLLDIPGWKTEDLPGAGIFYQSRPTFAVEDEDAYQEWQQKVKHHFNAVGVGISFDFPPL
jgi:hypothetical protein